MRTKEQGNGEVDSGGCRIALVDGDTATQATMRAHFATAEPEWRLETYASGEEALRGIPEAPPQVVLMDIGMARTDKEDHTHQQGA